MKFLWCSQKFDGKPLNNSLLLTVFLLPLTSELDNYCKLTINIRIPRFYNPLIDINQTLPILKREKKHFLLFFFNHPNKPLQKNVIHLYTNGAQSGKAHKITILRV